MPRFSVSPSHNTLVVGYGWSNSHCDYIHSEIKLSFISTRIFNWTAVLVTVYVLKGSQFIDRNVSDYRTIDDYKPLFVFKCQLMFYIHIAFQNISLLLSTQCNWVSMFFSNCTGLSKALSMLILLSFFVTGFFCHVFMLFDFRVWTRSV